MRDTTYVVTPRSRKRLSEPQKRTLLRAGENALNGECYLRVERRDGKLRVVETARIRAVTV